MKFSTVMQVPSSKNGRLLKMLARAEPRLAKVTGYQVKYVEKSGKQLTKFFTKEKTNLKCHRSDCAVCVNSDLKKNSMCQVKGVVYAGVCMMCDKEHAEKVSINHNGIYIGETARTLGERAAEHRAGYRRLDSKNFMFKHWSSRHSDSDTPPEFRFMVLKKHHDPLGRLIHESIKISDIATLNSKNEWGGGIRFPVCQ